MMSVKAWRTSVKMTSTRGLMLVAMVMIDSWWTLRLRTLRACLTRRCSIWGRTDSFSGGDCRLESSAAANGRHGRNGNGIVGNVAADAKYAGAGEVHRPGR